MEISETLANLYYDVLVLCLGTPDLEHLRWSFIHSLCKMQAKRYVLDSRLGAGGIFLVDGNIPKVIFDGNLDSTKEAMMEIVNHLICEVHDVIPAVTITTVKVESITKPRPIPVIKVSRCELEAATIR